MKEKVKNFKKAFTLVELIAVIFIVGMLFLLAIPPINKTIQDKRKDLLDTQYMNIQLGAQNWASDHLKDINTTSNIFTLTLGDLKNTGYVDENITNPITKKEFSNNMVIKIIVGNGKDVSYDIGKDPETDNNDEHNKNAPSIILNGENTQYIEINTAYKEQGFKALDKNGNNVTDVSTVYEKKTTTGYEPISSVDTSKLNMYRATYTASHNGLTTKAYRSIMVRDTIRPVITVDNHTKDYTISLNKNETFTVPTATVTDNSLETITATKTGSIDTTIDGASKITYEAIDSSGNKNQIVVTVYITSSPTCTIKITPTEYSKKATLTIESDNYLVSKFAFGTEEYSNVRTKKIIENGNYTAKVINNKGLVGNCSKEVTTIDNEKPIITYNTNLINNWSKEDFNVNVNIQDNISGIKSISYCKTRMAECVLNEELNIHSGSKNINFPILISDESLTNNICIKVVDIVGNEQQSCSKDVVGYYKLDKTLPSFTWSGPDKTIGKTDDIITYTLNLNEANIADSDINSTDFIINSTNGVIANILSIIKNNNQYVIKLKIVSGNGNVNLIPKAGIVSDLAGNVNASTPASNSVIVDNNPPTVTFNDDGLFNSNGWAKNDFNVNVVLADINNVTSSLYCQTTLETCTPNLIIPNNIIINENSDKNKICVLAIDSALNSKTMCKTYKLDKSLPTCNIANNPTNWTNSINLNVVGNDTVSGVKGIKNSTESNYTLGNNYNYAVNTNKEYIFNIIDNADNTNSCNASVTKLDKIIPTISSVSFDTNWTSTNKTITVTANDNESGISGYQITDNTNIPTSFITSGSSSWTSPNHYPMGTYYVWVKDNAGNISNYSSKNINKIDNTNPTSSLTLKTTDNNFYTSETCTNKNVNATLVGTDNESKIMGYLWNGSSYISVNPPESPLTKTDTISQVKNLNAKVKNEAGLESLNNSANVKIDKEIPIITYTINPSSPDGDNSFYKTMPMVNILGTDTGCAGFQGYKYQTSIDNGSYTSLSNIQTNNNEINNIVTNNECKNIQYKVIGYDNVFNESVSNQSAVFKYDQTVPIMTIEGHSSDYTKTFETSNSYPIPEPVVTDNCNQPVTITKTGSFIPAVGNTEGNFTITYKATDKAGNIKEITLTYIIKDTIGPNLNIDLNPSTPNGLNNWYKTDVGATITATDTGTGINNIKYCITNSSDCTPNTVITSGANVSINIEGNVLIKAITTDKAQIPNSTTSTKVIKIDKTKPNVTSAYAGAMLYKDPTFATGLNGISIYNNTGNGNVTINRQAISSNEGNYGLKITTSGTASPAHGGFSFVTQTEASKVFVTRIVAKIPVGYSINWGSNAFGGGTQSWLTSQQGTGSYEEYICKVTVGTNGTYSSTNFFYLSGGTTPTTNPIDWYVTYATVIDTTKWDINNNVIYVGEDNISGVVKTGYNTSNTLESLNNHPYTNNNKIGPIIKDLTLNNNYYAWVQDEAGNTNVSNPINVSYIDTTAPVATLSLKTADNNSYTSGACTNQNVTATLIATDDQSKIKGYLWSGSSYTNVNPPESPLTKTDTITTSKNINPKVINDAGLEKADAEANINIDKEKPTINVNIDPITPDGNNNFYKTLPNINVIGSDVGCGAYSGYKYQTSLNNSAYSSESTIMNTNNELNNFISNNECKEIGVKIKGYDGVNNSSTEVIKNLKFDKTKPVITVNGSTANQNETINIPDILEPTNTNIMSEATNDCITTIGKVCTPEQIKAGTGQSVMVEVAPGVKEKFYVVSNDNNNVTLIMDKNVDVAKGEIVNRTYTIPQAINVDTCTTPSSTVTGSVNPIVPGLYPINYTATDNAGNSTTLNLNVNVVDTYPPQIKSINQSTSACTNQSVTTEIKAIDNVDITGYSFDNANYTTAKTKTYNANGSYNVKVTDISNNIAINNFSIDNIDKTSPTIGITPENANYNNAITVEINV
ncbi:MAG: DUF5011 domain-containing protein, partial [Bacilli bacterium]